jgi:hypothetical protein
VISREALQARRDQLERQRDEMIAADQAEHSRMVGQINATEGALQVCEMFLAELDAAAQGAEAPALEKES